jgi:hypothetical protein
MDIVIPLKAGSHNDYLELRYALRSIEKYLIDYDDVYIIGSEAPDWYKGQIIFYNDTPDRKQHSIFNKLLAAPEGIYWNDDHFLLQPMYTNQLKPWYESTLSNALGEACGRYHTALSNTIQLIGPDALYYDVHTPCIFEKAKLQELQRYDWSKEYVIKSLYFNLHSDRFAISYHDLKINRILSFQAIDYLTTDRIFMSTGPNGAKGDMLKWLAAKYPTSSRWEK